MKLTDLSDFVTDFMTGLPSRQNRSIYQVNLFLHSKLKVFVKILEQITIVKICVLNIQLFLGIKMFFTCIYNFIDSFEIKVYPKFIVVHLESNMYVIVKKDR